MKARRPKPWPLARLYRTQRAAPVVFLALQNLADGKAVVCPTRPILAKATGIHRFKTISAALTVLHDAAWIQRIIVPFSSNKRGLRIILLYKGRKLPLTEHHAVKGNNRPNSKGQNSPQDSLTEREHAACSAAATPANAPNGNEHHSRLTPEETIALLTPVQEGSVTP